MENQSKFATLVLPGEEMKTSADFLDDLRARYGLQSDNAVAVKLLKMKRQQVSVYRQKQHAFDDTISIKVAELLDIEPGYVMACMAAQRAKSPEVRSLWERIAVGLAACVVVGVGLAGTPTPSQAGFNNNRMGASSADGNTHMRTRRRRKPGASLADSAAGALSALGWLVGVRPHRNAF
jgi:hypothetical protein